MFGVSKLIQHRKLELGLTIIVIILSGASASLVIFGPLDIIPYATLRDIAIIPSIIAIFAIGILVRSKFPRLTNRLFIGMAAGAIASFALEAIRIPVAENQIGIIPITIKKLSERGKPVLCPEISFDSFL